MNPLCVLGDGAHRGQILQVETHPSLNLPLEWSEMGDGGAAMGEMASKYGRIKKVLESQEMEDTGK